MLRALALPSKLGVSLFTGAGIGDIGYRASGIDFIGMLELEPERADLARANFPQAEIIDGDIQIEFQNVIDVARSTLEQHSSTAAEIFLLTCTAPCQGMSKSGQGTLLKNIRAGLRPKLDPRNRLILPALSVIAELQPRFVVFENVCEMRHTMIEDESGQLRKILEIIDEYMPSQYVGQAYDVEMADYGIPQRRKRLITVYTRDESAKSLYASGVPLVPAKTHASNIRDGLRPWVPVTQVLDNFAPLDAGNKQLAADETDTFHRVPLLDARKYWWVSNTPKGASAFDNQCVSPSCGSSSNLNHGNFRTAEGINRARLDTPIYCQSCGELLPRPSVQKEDGTFQIMKGYTSAYKRMRPDVPSPALTRNFSFACSDNKLHPYQNRVLSISEALTIHTLSDYEVRWGPVKTRAGKVRDTATDTLIRVVVGESIPPRFCEILGRHLDALSKGIGAFPPTFEVTIIPQGKWGHDSRAGISAGF